MTTAGPLPGRFAGRAPRRSPCALCRRAHGRMPITAAVATIAAFPPARQMPGGRGRNSPRRGGAALPRWPGRDRRTARNAKRGPTRTAAQAVGGIGATDSVVRMKAFQRPSRSNARISGSSVARTCGTRAQAGSPRRRHRDAACRNGGMPGTGHPAPAKAGIARRGGPIERSARGPDAWRDHQWLPRAARRGPGGRLVACDALGSQESGGGIVESLRPLRRVLAPEAGTAACAGLPLVSRETGIDRPLGHRLPGGARIAPGQSPKSPTTRRRQRRNRGRLHCRDRARRDARCFT